MIPGTSIEVAGSEEIGTDLKTSAHRKILNIPLETHAHAQEQVTMGVKEIQLQPASIKPNIPRIIDIVIE